VNNIGLTCFSSAGRASGGLEAVSLSGAVVVSLPGPATAGALLLAPQPILTARARQGQHSISRGLIRQYQRGAAGAGPCQNCER